MPLIHVLLFGQGGAGKSFLGNRLLESNTSSRDRFTERNEGTHGHAYGCQYLHAYVNHAGEEYNLRIVDTPGLFQEGVTKEDSNWKDVVQAFYTSNHQVDVFLIVLKASEPRKSEEVTESFVNFFGSNAPLNVVVVFTYIENTTVRQILFENHEYLEKYLRYGYPFVLWKGGQNASNISELMEKIVETNQLKSYENAQFSSTQLEYAKKWIQREKKDSRRKKMPPVKNAEDLGGIGIPDVLYEKILSNTQLKELIEFVNK